MRLSAKIALVTGAGLRLGATSRAPCNGEGAKVVLLDLDDGAQAVAAATGPDAFAACGRCGDQRCSGQPPQRSSAARSRATAALTSFTNAGWTTRTRPLLEVSEAEFDKVQRLVNVKSNFINMIQAVAQPMQRQGGPDQQYRDRRPASVRVPA